MSTIYPPIWRLRLARDDAAAAVREAVDFYHACERGEAVPERDVTIPADKSPSEQFWGAG